MSEDAGEELPYGLTPELREVGQPDDLQANHDEAISAIRQAQLRLGSALQDADLERSRQAFLELQAVIESFNQLSHRRYVFARRALERCVFRLAGRSQPDR